LPVEPAMNPSRVPMPNAPLRSHNIVDSSKNPSASYSSPRTPSEDTEITSGSAAPLANPEISSELTDEGENGEDDSIEAQLKDESIFATVAEARHWQLRQQNNNHGRTDDTLLAEAEKGAIVAKLVNRFSYLAPEALTNSDGTKRCADVTKANIEHAITHPKTVEALCWDLLEETIRRYEGNPLCAVYAPLKCQTTGGAFADRVKGAIKALKISKNLCKRLFEPSFASRVIDDPWNEIRKIQTNDKLNKRKQEMKKGMQLQQSEATEGSTTGVENESDDGEPEPKRSRRQSAKKA